MIYPPVIPFFFLIQMQADAEDDEEKRRNGIDYTTKNVEAPMVSPTEIQKAAERAAIAAALE
jgi:hypothetical protein